MQISLKEPTAVIIKKRKKEKKENNIPHLLCWSQDNIWIAEKDKQSFSVFSHKILK